MESLLDKYKDQIAVGGQVVGTNASARSGDHLREVVAQLYYEFGITQWGEQYDIVLGGGFLSVRNPGYLAAGEVTYAQLQGLFPFDNQLVLCSILGRDLKSKFFYTTNGNYFIYYDDYGASVKQNIDDDATYYVVVDTYTSSYAPNRLTVVEQYDVDLFARDLLADYIADGGFEGN